MSELQQVMEEVKDLTPADLLAKDWQWVVVPGDGKERDRLCVVVASRPSATANRKQKPQLRSWRQPELDDAIRKYIAHRAGPYKSMAKAVKDGCKGAITAARQMFGRNVIAKAMRVKSAAMVSKSEPWREIASELGLLSDGSRRLKNADMIGLEIAIETAAEDSIDEVNRQDQIRFVREKLKGETAESILEQLEQGVLSPERLQELVALLSDDDDAP